jgi:hypothetical protein
VKACLCGSVLHAVTKKKLAANRVSALNVTISGISAKKRGKRKNKVTAGDSGVNKNTDLNCIRLCGFWEI